MDIKLTQDISSSNQDSLFLVLLKPRKSYATIDHGRLISTLGGYGVGTQTCKLLSTFWVHQEVNKRQNGYCGPGLKLNQGTLQGGIISPTLFNVGADNVVRKWLALTV